MIYIPLLELKDKDTSLQISYSPDNKDAVGFKIFADNKPSPVINVSLTRHFDKFAAVLLKSLQKVQDSEEDISIPITINKYQQEVKQYKVVAVIVLNKSKGSNNLYTMIVKDSSFRHEFIFTMTNDISIGGEKLSEHEKSKIAFNAFINRVSMMETLHAFSKTQYKISNNTTTGGASSQKPNFKNSYDRKPQTTEPEIDFS